MGNRIGRGPTCQASRKETVVQTYPGNLHVAQRSIIPASGLETQLQINAYILNTDSDSGTLHVYRV